MNINPIRAEKNPQSSFTYFLLQILLGGEHKISWFESFCKIFAEIQIIGLRLNYSFQIGESKETEPFGVFAKQFSRILCFNIFDFSRPSTLNDIFCVIIILYLFIQGGLLLILLLSQYFRKPQCSFIMKLWVNLGVFHYTCFFLLSHQYILSLTNQTNQPQASLFGQNLHTGFLVMGIVLILPNIILAIYFCRFSYDPLQNKGYRTPTTDLLNLLIKLVEVPITVFVSNEEARKWIRISIMLIIIILRLKTYLSYAPCFDYKTFKLGLRFTFFHAGLITSHIVIVILEQTTNTSSISSIYLCAIFSLFFIKYTDIKLESLIKTYSTESIHKLKNEEGFYLKLLALDYVIDKGLMSARFGTSYKEHYTKPLFHGILYQHKLFCNKSDCGCNLVSKNPNELSNIKFTPHEEKERVKRMKFNIIKNLHKEGLKSISSNSRIKIGLANLIFQSKGLFSASAINLIHGMNVEGGSRSVEIKVLGMMVLKRSEMTLDERDNGRVNVREVVDYHMYSHILRQSIGETILAFVEFWETFKSGDPLVRKLYTISTKINTKGTEINSHWTKLVNKFPKLSYQDHLLYGLYQSLIRNAPHSAQKTLDTYFAFSNTTDSKKAQEVQINQENLHELNNIFICISMKKDKLGIVTFLTSNVEDYLQFEQKEVLDKDVNFLMSPFFQDRHKKILVQHIQKGNYSKSTVFHRSRVIFARRKDNSIIPCSLYVTLFPYFQQQLSYVGILRPLHSYDNFILVQSDGVIDSFTEEVGRILKLSLFHGKKVHLKEISKDLAILHKSFQAFVKGEQGKIKTYFTSSNVFGSRPFSLNMLTSNDESHELKKETSAIYTIKQKNSYQETYNHIDSDLEETHKLYEQFTSVGSTAKFNPIWQEGAFHSQGEIEEFEFNVIISEEIILGSHIRVYRLQSFNENGRKDKDNSPRKRTEIIKFSDVKESPPPLDLSMSKEVSIPGSIAQDNGIEMDNKEDDIQFKNPFASPTEKGNDISPIKNNVTSPQDVCTPLVLNFGSSDYSLHNPRNTLSTGADTKKNQALNFIARVTSVKKMSRKFSPKQFFLRKVLNETKDSKGKEVRSNENQTSSLSRDNPHKKGKFDLKHFLREHDIIGAPGKEDNGDNHSVTSSVKASNIDSKLEHAIYYNEKDKSINILKLCVIIFFLGSLGMLACSQYITLHTVENIQNNIEILQTLSMRLYYIIEVNRRARVINLQQRGYTNQARLTEDYALTNLELISASVGNLSLYNIKLRNLIYNVDPSIKLLFYVPINEYIKENITQTRPVNTFDLCTQLVSAAMEINQNYPMKPAWNESNLNFILHNSLNDLIVATQDSVSLLGEDNGIQMSGIQNTMFGTLIGAIIFSIIIFLIAFRIENRFIRTKSRFIELFLMIKDYEIEPHLIIAKNFHTSILKNKESSLKERATMDKLVIKTKGSSAKHKENKGFKSKHANFRGFNTPTYWNLLWILIYLIIFIIIFTIMLSRYLTTKDPIQDSRLRAINSQITFIRLGIIYTSLYEYISENRTTNVRGLPIDPVWESTYSLIAEANSVYAKLIEVNKPYNEEVEYLLSGDLCQTYFRTRACYSENFGVASKGLIAMESFMLKALRGVKDFYDSSNKTFEAQKEALQLRDFLDAELIYEVYTQVVYSVLGVVLVDQYNAEMRKLTEQTKIVTIVSVILFAIITKVIFFWVSERMEQERMNYRNMLRVIPINVIISNRFLRNYLLTHSRNILDTVKNKM